MYALTLTKFSQVRDNCTEDSTAPDLKMDKSNLDFVVQFAPEL